MCSSLPALSNGWGYTHSLCCLFGRKALRCASPADAPIPPGVLSRRRSGSRSPALWSRCWLGTAKAAVLGFAKGSVSGGRDKRCLFSAFTWQIQCLLSGLGSTRCGVTLQQTLQLSDSEELDVVSANAMYTEDSPPQLHAYEELVEVVTRVVKRLSIGHQRGRTFVQKADLMNTCRLAHNLNTGDCHFSPHRGVEIIGETGFL